MRGRSTREHDFQRECADASRESTIFRENARTLHARARFSTRMKDFFCIAGRQPCTSDRPSHRSGYYFTFLLFQPCIRHFERFSTRMRGRFTRERDFQPECADASRESTIFNGNARTLHARARFSTGMRVDAPRESAIFGENARMLHARARFSARMRRRSTRERDFQRECADAPRESAIFRENARTHHARARLSARMRGRSTREHGFQRECTEASRESAIFRENARTPRGSAIFRENARTLHARERFSARMRGRFTREHDFPRECEDAPRESAVFNENERYILHRGPPTLYVGPPFSPVGLLFYYFTISTMNAISSKNARTLHARARFSTRMRGRFTRKRDFQPECADAPRESTIFNGNARTLHARARFSTGMRGRSTRERDFR